MSQYSIYLAGPISGLTYDGSEEWRNQFKSWMPPEIACYSPLRSKDYLRAEGILEQSYSQPLSSDRGIMTRDHFDCSRVDLIVCNLLGTKRVSIGTVMECAWAFAYRKPLVMIMEDENVHDHPMIRETIGFRVATLEDAALLVQSVLLKG